METKDIFMEYLQQEKNQCMEEEQHLIQDERKDEANLCKVKLNIYDICHILYKTARKETEWKDVFLSKTEGVSANWKKSLVTAKEHGDIKKTVIEETKLATMEKIVEQFQTL